MDNAPAYIMYITHTRARVLARAHHSLSYEVIYRKKVREWRFS